MNDPRLRINLGYPDPPPPPDLADKARRRGAAMRRRRRVAGGAGLMAASLALVLSVTVLTREPAAQPTGGRPTPTTGSVPISPSPEPDTTATPAPPTTGSSPGASSDTPSDTAATTCAFTDLKVSLGTSQGSAGHVELELLFVNTSSHPCTLRGTPGVSFLDATGQQLGPAAARDHTANPVVTLTLAPGATAYSSLYLTNPGVYGAPGSAPCNSAQTTQLRIYPPGSREAALLAFRQQVCTTNTGQAQVRPVAAGRMP